MEQANPAQQAAWHEVQVLLDEEIDRLPEMYREPFVLYYLANLGCADVGRRLGINESAVWNRLAEARKRLQTRLTRRGISLSVASGAIALAPGQTTASLPAGLAASAARAALASGNGAVATGVMSKQVAALVRGAATSLPVTKAKVWMAIVLGLSALGGTTAIVGCMLLMAMLAAGWLVPTSAEGIQEKVVVGQAPLAVQLTAEPVPADGPAISVGGVVLTPEGKPVEGAVVILHMKNNVYWMGLKHNHDVLARTTSNARGQFTFEKIAIPPRHDRYIRTLFAGEGGAELLAWADGKAIAWHEVRGLKNEKQIRLALAPEAKVEGTIRDKAGRPMPNVLLTVLGLTHAKENADLDFLTSDDNSLRLILSEASPEVTSNAQGEFTLHHLPPDYRVSVSLVGPELGWKNLVVDTGDDKQLTEVVYPRTKEAIPVMHSPLRIIVEPQRFVTIKIVDAAGQPIRDGAIAMCDDQRLSVGGGWVDGQGEARIRIPKPGRYELIYSADPLHPRLGASLTVDIKDGTDTPVFQMRLPSSKWLPGRVVDADTGKPIVGAYVCYELTGNPAAKAIWSQAVSDAKGEFRIPAAVGQGNLGFVHPVFGYFPPIHGNQPDLSMAPPRMVIDVPQAGDPKQVVLSLGRGLGVRGTVRDSGGKPVAGAVVEAIAENLNGGFYHGEQKAKTNFDGRFELSGLSPYRKHMLVALGTAGWAKMALDGSQKQWTDRAIWKDMDFRLKQGGVVVTGRVLHDGKPRASVVMKLMHTLGKALPEGRGPGGGPDTSSDPNGYFLGGEVKTDSDGRYRIGGLQSEERFLFEIQDPEGMTDNNWHHQFPWASEAVPQGQADVELPDVNLVANNQSLRGVVVDPKGKTLARINVSASLVGGGTIIRGLRNSPPWRDGPPTSVKTDDQGRFDLRGLPDLPLELTAYKQNASGEIKHETTIRPKLNQQDVRIVLDPSLNEEIENLDAPKKSPAGKK